MVRKPKQRREIPRNARTSSVAFGPVFGKGLKGRAIWTDQIGEARIFTMACKLNSYRPQVSEPAAATDRFPHD
jgi:hypothetical protein